VLPRRPNEGKCWQGPGGPAHVFDTRSIRQQRGCVNLAETCGGGGHVAAGRDACDTGCSTTTDSDMVASGVAIPLGIGIDKPILSRFGHRGCVTGCRVKDYDITSAGSEYQDSVS
jgi:hypothetical protein